MFISKNKLYNFILMRCCTGCKKENLAMYYFEKMFYCFKCFKDLNNTIKNYQYYL